MGEGGGKCHQCDHIGNWTLYCVDMPFLMIQLSISFNQKIGQWIYTFENPPLVKLNLNGAEGQ